MKPGPGGSCCDAAFVFCVSRIMESGNMLEMGERGAACGPTKVLAATRQMKMVLLILSCVHS